MRDDAYITGSPNHAYGDGGFSLVEALVILAISSVLLFVLTSTIGLSRDQNARLAEHSRLAGDKLYADLQLQALLDSLYIDPLLQASGAKPSVSNRRAAIHTQQSWAELDSDIAFEGNSEAFEFTTQYHADGARPVPAQVQWIDSVDGRRLSVNLEGRVITWPVIYDPQTRFRYLTPDNQLLDMFPPPQLQSNESRLVGGNAPIANPILVPKAIMAYREDTRQVVFIVDVP
ncbi:MAG: type II secretion system protein [Pseudomonadota bacterium]